MIYFDHNATAPLLPEAKQAWLKASEEFIGNPSSPHRFGSRAENALNEGREKLAHILGCDAAEIIWTAGATESNNLVLHHLAKSLGDKKEVWISAIEHPCVLAPAKYFFQKKVKLIPVNSHGLIELDWLQTRLKKQKPGLIAIMAANNETGLLQPWRDVLKICRENKIPFFCDAAQWIGKLPAEGFGGCDFVSGCAHKFGGPKGVGFLKCPIHGKLFPMFQGGKQEEGRRAGTENVAGIISMMAALEEREKQLTENEIQNRISLRNHFEINLLQNFPGARIIGASHDGLWNTVSVIMPETDSPQRWAVKLDKLGFAVSTGSACASGREEPSHVLRAMGISFAEASRVLRFSSSWETSADEWNQLLEALQKVRQKINLTTDEKRESARLIKVIHSRARS
ncbi:MAG: cysteine desulfurase family protein [Limisphaerales bacterium]